MCGGLNVYAFSRRRACDACGSWVFTHSLVPQGEVFKSYDGKLGDCHECNDTLGSMAYSKGFEGGGVDEVGTEQRRLEEMEWGLPVELLLKPTQY